jgi:hypothetical protein
MEHNENTVRSRAQPISMLQAQPTGMLLSAHLISIEIQQSTGENG